MHNSAPVGEELNYTDILVTALSKRYDLIISFLHWPVMLFEYAYDKILFKNYFFSVLDYVPLRT